MSAIRAVWPLGAGRHRGVLELRDARTAHTLQAPRLRSDAYFSISRRRSPSKVLRLARVSVGWYQKCCERL